MNQPPKKLSMVANAANNVANPKHQPTEDEINKAKEQVAFLSDIVMRMLANRDLVICLNTCATVLNTVAEHTPEQGRMYIAKCLHSLADDILDMKDETKQ